VLLLPPGPAVFSPATSTPLITWAIEPTGWGAFWAIEYDLAST
jgi:hypothetical protein